MKPLILSLAIGLGVTAVAPSAFAGDTFDSSGWVLLGEQTVDGPRDTDVIKVGRKEGRFEKLTMVVLDDDLSLASMKIILGDGETLTPAVRQVFQQGARTRAIDLPGDARGIASIELTYGNIETRDHRGKARAWRGVRDNGKARVQVWGLEAKEQAPASVWNPRGWTMVAQKRVTARSGKVTLAVARGGLMYEDLTLNVDGSDLRITGVVVTYRKGRKETINVGHDYRDGARQKGIAIDGSRPIKSITVTYAGRGRGKAAVIQVFGKDRSDRRDDDRRDDDRRDGGRRN